MQEEDSHKGKLLPQLRCENVRGGDAVKTFAPYPHQYAGIDWILQHPACALFWGMG